jgi:hypothetical protein
MINAKIVGTYLGKVTDAEEKNSYVGVSILVGTKDKQYQIGPVPIDNVQAIAMILAMTEAGYWENLVGKPIRIDVTDDAVIRMANIVDDEMYMDLVQPEEEVEEKVED